MFGISTKHAVCDQSRFLSVASGIIACAQAILYPPGSIPQAWTETIDSSSLSESAIIIKMTTMELLLLYLILAPIYFSKSLLLPLNSSSVLQLPSSSQDDTTPLATVEENSNMTHNTVSYNPWPFVPWQCQVKTGLVITITGYGDSLSQKHIENICQALLQIQRVITDDGKPTDILEENTAVGETRGRVYAEVGFYSLRPPGGIRRSDAAEVIRKIWQLLVEFVPAREIAMSTVIARGKGLALFRLSFRLV